MRRKRITSPYIIVRRSRIHNKGVFARKDIPRGTRVIEYVGEKITKTESDRRAVIPLKRHKTDSARHGAVYIFHLNRSFDLDGDVYWNTAKYINHSCEPNCEAEIIRGCIYIIALRDIPRGEEITYNYGYCYEDYEEHPCLCGSSRCPGYILAEEHWPKLHALKNGGKRELKR